MTNSPEADRLEQALSAFIAFQTSEQGLEEFLAAHEGLRDLLEPMFEDTEDEPAVGVEVPTPLRRLGDFDLLSELGRGGMGTVYRARQRSVDRIVALKVLWSDGLANPQAVTRFHREASLAGRLSHPGIIEVFTVGSEGDAHFFAMELIDGVPLHEVIRDVRARMEGGAEKPGKMVESGRETRSGMDGEALRSLVEAACMPERRDSGRKSQSVGREGVNPGESVYRRTYVESMVAVALQVADALHSAHAAQVLHRDVKPSNVLIRRDGRVVLADFGLAREEGLPSMTLSGEFLGTPYYVSPEQARGEKDEIGPGADVFSLGAMLYEMVTLTPPFEGKTSAEVLHRLAHEEPVDPQKRDRGVSTDLAAVILRCLEKDPFDRYADAGELAMDLRALLENRPVRARRVSAGTRLARWVQRNRALSITGLVGAALLLVGSVVAGVIFYQQAQTLRLAQAETNSVNEFLVEKLIFATDPRQHLGKKPSIEQVLVVATEEVGKSFAGQPLLEASVRHTLGKAWAKLGNFEQAREQLVLSRELRAARQSEEDLARLETEAEIAFVHRSMSEFEEAKKISARVLPLATRALGPDHDLVLRLELGLALANHSLGEFDEAERQCRAYLEHSARVRGREHRDTLGALHQLARILESRGALVKAEAMFRDVKKRRALVLPENHPDRVAGLSDLANLLLDRGKAKEACELATLANRLTVEIYGERHPRTILSRNILAFASQYMGRQGDGKNHYATARKHFEELVALRASVYGEGSASHARGLNNLGVILCDMGLWKEAARSIEAAKDSYVKALGSGHRDTLATQFNLSAVLIQAKRYREALTVAQECVRRGAEVFGREHHVYGGYLVQMGACHQLLGERAEALPVALRGYKTLVASQDPQSSNVRRAARIIGKIYKGLGDTENAQLWLARSRRKKDAPSASSATQPPSSK